VATKRQSIEVGVFLTVMFAILAVVLIAIAGLREEHLDPYHITFEESVAGLSVGSKVTYRGVPVGKITDLLVSEENLISVTIGVNPEKATLREGVEAKYSMETIFGPFTIDLSGGAPDARALDPGEEIPVATSLLGGIEKEIPGTLVDIRKVASHVRAIIEAVKPEDVSDIAERAKTLLTHADEGVTDIRSQVKGLAKNTDEAVTAALAELKKSNAALQPTLKQLQESVTKLNDILNTTQQMVGENREPVRKSLQHLQQVAQTLDQQLKELDLPAVIKGLEASAAKVGTAAESVGVASKAVAEGRREVTRSVETIERSLLRSLDELERALRAGRALLETLERDPSAILRGKREPEGD
jgi:phospholipid/cholesterol/gamma-HCH transport system substrate-binding protein